MKKFKIRFVSAVNKQAQSIGSKLVCCSCNGATHRHTKRDLRKTFGADYAAHGVSGEQIL